MGSCLEKAWKLLQGFSVFHNFHNTNALAPSSTQHTTMAAFKKGDEDVDWFAVLEIKPDCTKKQISKAYKVAALKYHPDKNRDDPHANEKFHLVQKAYEILSDDKAREALNNVYKAKVERKKRDEQMDVKRRKMKQDLEEREAKFKKQKTDEDDARKKWELELERLRRESALRAKTKMEEDARRKAEQAEREAQHRSNQQAETVLATLKVEWDKKKGAYTKEQLEKLFQAFGDVEYIVVGKKGQALVAFKNITAARVAINQPLGDPINRLSIQWASGEPPNTTASPATLRTPSGPSVSLQDHLDFEQQVLQKLRAAAERQQQQQSHPVEGTPIVV